MNKGSVKTNLFLILGVLVLIGAFAFFIYPKVFGISYNSEQIIDAQNATVVNGVQKVDGFLSSSNTIPITHLATPEPLKAIYISAWTAGSKKHKERIINLIDSTEINAVVIDVKDSTGYVSFHSENTLINELKSSQARIADIRALTNELHAKNIYIIGRISVFQDPYMTKAKPEWAVKKKSDGTVWKDRKGLSFLDPANKEVWNYTKEVALTAYSVGFDEINFDYIRYPSDGNVKDINYNLIEGKTRADNIEEFFKYLHTEMKKDAQIPTSADLFGLTTTELTDMGIGQVWEKALPYFDYIAPMVYPSHFGSNWNGYKNPATKPYEVVNFTMQKGIERAVAMGQSKDKIRPWLQDFDLGADYTSDMIRAQIKATNDAGLSSWMLWDPKNQYTKEALLNE